MVAFISINLTEILQEDKAVGCCATILPEDAIFGHGSQHKNILFLAWMIHESKRQREDVFTKTMFWIGRNDFEKYKFHISFGRLSKLDSVWEEV